MVDFKDITAQRWFMGKSRKVLSVNTVDSIALGGITFSIAEVQFLNGEQDHYLLIENEKEASKFFKEAFPAKAETRSFQGTCGTFLFTTYREFDPQELEALHPLLPHGIRAYLRPHGRQKAQTIQRNDQV